MTRPSFLAVLADSLRRLASPSDEQISYLTGLGVADLVDELALEFEAALLPLQQLDSDENVVVGRFLDACRRVDQTLNNPQLRWRFTDLDSEPWNAVRAAANAALTALVQVCLEHAESTAPAYRE